MTAVNQALKDGAADALNAAAGITPVSITMDGDVNPITPGEAKEKPGLMDRTFGKTSSPAGKTKRLRDGLSPAKAPAGAPLTDQAPAVSQPAAPDPELAGLVQVPFMLLAARYGDEMLLTEKEAKDLGGALGPVLTKYGYGQLDKYAAELTLLSVGLLIAMPRIAVIRKKTPAAPKPQAAKTTAEPQPDPNAGWPAVTVTSSTATD